MKKFKKKIGYVVKTMMAIGLLFTNVLPFSTVLAEGLDDYLGDGVTENENGNVSDLENENKDENLVVDPEGDQTEGETNPQVEGENPTNDTEDTAEGTDLTTGDNTTPVTDGGDLAVDNNSDDTTESGSNETPVTAPTNEETPTDETVTEASLLYEVYVDGEGYTDDAGLVTLDKNVTNLEIVAKLSGAEATDSYTFTIDGNSYATEALLNGVVVKSLSFPGYLYGTFNLELDGMLTDPEGNEEEHWMNYVVEYGEEADNAEALSAVNSDYVFSENVLTTTKYDEEILRQIISETFPNANIVDLSDTEVLLNDDHSVYIWYGIITKGDVNGDGKIDQEDLELLINQTLGTEDVTDGSDVNGDGEVNDLDAAYLKLMLESGTDEEIHEDEEVTIDAKFGEFSGPVKVGEEFTLQYIVTLKEYSINGISGLVNYDKSLLELANAKSTEFNLGDMNVDKFLYLGDYLDLDIEVEKDEEGNVILDEEGMPTFIINDVEYVLIELTFKALKAGTANVSVDGVKFFDWSSYYTQKDATSIDVVIEENSPFVSLQVSGHEVDLSNYSVTVPNDVTKANVVYTLNDNYSVTSIAAPEELAVGENTITIVVTNPDGSEETYTIKVTREGASENSSNVAPMNYTDGDTYDDGGSEEPDVAPVPSDDGDDKKVTPADDEEDNAKKANSLSRIIIIILILLAIAGLIYLIFKDEDDEETKKANKEIDKMKKEDEKKTTKKVDNNKKPKKKER